MMQRIFEMMYIKHRASQVALVVQMVQRGSFDPWAGKIPWRRKWQPTLVFLPGKFHGQQNLVDYSL